ncbi:hypothetical protein TTHERM_00107020 (macronuclear) [Tetrahymena thermophila SB210]|uniref:RING-type domain-containing protein n=1 Tax=Tetrahymena thermophila (strain SB210) TaxID=312017 RepID=Q234A2_TETTS|nr:hypothetical protein TTHERM_00107020 [Tetrahymena thermophila SB210]EAR92100.2 hypothetical protein TTHERM_00107020 [Tetrahymena thermophila SB210]|eukprot:XP_001012346.2 hypothetical protein TTHERM_00107020 [Tetrahymena thermophila SB210]
MEEQSLEANLEQHIQHIIDLYQDSLDQNTINCINLYEAYPQLSQVNFIHQMDASLFLIQGKEGILWILNATDMNFQKFDIVKKNLCENTEIVREHNFIILNYQSLIYFIQLKIENQNLELELVDIYEVDSRDNIQIKKILFNRFYDKEFYVLQIFVLTKQNQVIQINKGYCEYEERIIIDLEKSEKQITDLALLNGKLYLLFNDQYIVVSQENTEYFEFDDDFQQFINFQINNEDKLAFLGHNKISFEGIEYLFDNAEILDFKGEIDNKNSKNFLIQLNRRINYVSFDFEANKLNKILDLSELQLSYDIKSIFEINNSSRMFLVVNKMNDIFLMSKFKFYNYMLSSVSNKINYIQFYEQYATIMNKKLSLKNLKRPYRIKIDQKNNTYESNSNLDLKESYENNQGSDSVDLGEKQNKMNYNLQNDQTQQNRIQFDKDQFEDLNNSYNSDEVLLDMDTQQLIQQIKECEDQKKRRDQKIEESDDQNDEQSDYKKYEKIQSAIDKFQQIKSNKQVIVDILKEGVYQTQMQYSKYLYNGKQVNKQQEICQICKKLICVSNDDNSKQPQQQRNKVEGKIFFILCRHSFHKHCILFSPTYSQNFKFNQCPVCANYECLQDLPAHSFF